MAWVNEIEAKGNIWASPGPYLRHSMLLTLARKISDHFLPEALYGTTFHTAVGSAARPPEEEKDLVLSLASRIKDTRRARSEEAEDLDSSNDSN